MEISKKQKEAIEELEEFIKGPCETCKYCESAYKLNRKNIIQLLNLNKKLQKENEKYKRLSKINLKDAEEFKDNVCEHRCLLKSENEELKTRLDELSKKISQLYIKGDK